MSDLILSETRGAVALLTLNRPNKLNALSYALIDQLMAVLDRIEDDPRVGAIVLTGRETAPSRRAPTSPNSPKA